MAAPLHYLGITSGDGEDVVARLQLSAGVGPDGLLELVHVPLTVRQLGWLAEGATARLQGVVMGITGTDGTLRQSDTPAPVVNRCGRLVENGMVRYDCGVDVPVGPMSSPHRCEGGAR